MFDGMTDQFYQFLAAGAGATTSTRTRTTPTTSSTNSVIAASSLPFSLHHSNFATYSSPPQPTFDASFHLLHHHSQFLSRNEVKEEITTTTTTTTTTLNNHPPTSIILPLTSLHHDNNLTRTSLMLPEIPWSNDEMLALFRIRSSMDNSWFPDFIWENVSRKLEEVGFKRSAEKCKEKFEEETRSFNSCIINNSNNNNNKNNASINYRLFGELEELCNNNANNNDNNIHGDDIDHHQTRLPPPPPPPPPPILDESDHPQTSFSERDEFPDEDEDEDEDDVDDKNGEERLGDDDDDDEEGEDTRNNDKIVEDEQSVGDSEKTEENTKRVMRKRKRQKKFEMFRGFCEKIVNKMMAQQEQLHCKILQDMVKRDEEKIAKEEAWKKQEFERLQKGLEVRAHEEAISGDRQAKILDCLKKFSTSSSSSNILGSHHSLKETLENLNKVTNNITLSNNSSILTQSSINAQLQTTSSCTTNDHNHAPLVNHQTCPNIPTSPSNENVSLLSPISLDNPKLALPIMSSSSMDQAAPQNPNPVISSHNTLENRSDLKSIVGNGKNDTGRRWPRDEVLALINIRCSLFNNNSGDVHQDREAFSKGPLWERISQKMMELGYKRNAKRCKEKWENINKYFRKTKDMNKKRSIDSRTCPYFHQLNHLYSQGTLMGPTDRPINLPGSPEHSSMAAFSEAQGGSITPVNGASATNTMHGCQGNQGVVQVPGFDFEF
ncbi:hypothetical protein BVRB_4g083670 [Beta vulgaris subsp. vulgaris]|nr:hypothetical protein BVRB_4g083670 [Beta vulgaris subsp. vulgaris]